MPLFTYPIAPIALYDGEPASGASTALSANTIYYVAQKPLQAPTTLTTIVVRFAAGGNGHYDVGIYSDNNGAPGTLLVHAASSNTSLATATGVQTPALIGGNLALSPGNYWLALWIDNATDTVSRISGTAAIQSGPLKVQSSATAALPSTPGTISNGTIKPILIGEFLNSWS